MKKIIVIVLMLCFCLSVDSFAANNSLTSINARLMQESSNLKSMFKNSRDVVLLTTMWDSYFIARTQLDAYFYMVALFESVKKAAVTDVSVDYLLNWLGEIRKTNTANIKTLNSTVTVIDQATKSAVDRMETNIADLNNAVDKEIIRLNSLKEAIKKKLVR
jgi:hypothetical protein